MHRCFTREKRSPILGLILNVGERPQDETRHGKNQTTTFMSSHKLGAWKSIQMRRGTVPCDFRYSHAENVRQSCHALSPAKKEKNTHAWIYVCGYNTAVLVMGAIKRHSWVLTSERTAAGYHTPACRLLTDCLQCFHRRRLDLWFLKTFNLKEEVDV